MIGRSIALPRRVPDAAAVVAAVLAFASAACTAFWLLGGTAGLDTVGGEVERLARERSPAAIAGLAVTLVLKLLAGALAVLLVALGDGGPPPHWVVRLALVGGIGLALYGGLLVAVGALALIGVVGPSDPGDQYALRWHVFFWDLWFLVWGAALALGAKRARSAFGAYQRAPSGADR